MRARRLLCGLTLGAALLQLSCESPSGPGMGGMMAHFLQWSISRPDQYTMVQQRLCFCPGGDTAAQVTVRDGIITGIVNDVTKAPLPREQWSAYKSIDDLFAIIERYSHDPDASVDARYDDVDGYPTWISVDPIPQAVDDEFTYTCAHVKRIPAQPAPRHGKDAAP